MKTKLLKKLRKKFFKRYTVVFSPTKSGDCFRIFDEGCYCCYSNNREDLRLRLRELYFSFLEEYVAEHKEGKKKLTYWW